MTISVSIIRPDDWHVHLRDGAMLRAVLPFTAQVFARAIAMPNLKTPITSTARAVAYRDEIISALPSGNDFTPLMTAYLTDSTDVADLESGFSQGILTAAKLYPANATTNSANGISERTKAYPALEMMQRTGMPLLIHGEVTDPDVDIFDREAAFIERELIPLRRDFPQLKVVLEHITTEEAAAYVLQESSNGCLAATITAHHLLLNRNAIFAGGIRPHHYCLPVAKREKHRLALVKAATSGASCFFLGTDSAPHAASAKECACGCAGIFTAPNALELYAHVFEEAGKMDKLEAFASLNGSKFYGLSPNAGRIGLIKSSPEEIKPILTCDGQKIIPFAPPSQLKWRVV